MPAPSPGAQLTELHPEKFRFNNSWMLLEKYLFCYIYWEKSIATNSVGIVDFLSLPLIIGSVAKDRNGTVTGPAGQHLRDI